MLFRFLITLLVIIQTFFGFITFAETFPSSRVEDSSGELREVPTGLEFLIISPNSLVSTLEPFVQWKNQKGIRTYVASLAETGSTKESIKGYIQGLYNNPETRPEFILLIGKHYQIPGWYTPGGWGSVGGPDFLSDTPYVRLGGDEFTVDAHIGRFPAQSALQLLTMINRTIQYEQEPVIDGSEWMKKAVMICPQEQSISTKSFIADLLIDNDFVQVDEHYDMSGGDEVIEALNEEGRNFVNFRGVIDESDGYGIETDVIDPQGKFPFFTWLTCGKCDYSFNDYCVEWMLDGDAANPQGAIGFVGGTQVTYTDPYVHRRDALDKGMYLAFFDDDIDERVQTLGESLEKGKLYMLDQYPIPDDASRDTYEHFVLMGDPTVNLWTDTPTNLDVQHEVAIPRGNIEFSVVVTDEDGNPIQDEEIEIKVTITNEDMSIFISEIADDEGHATLSFIAEELEPLTLVVSGHNLVPYIATVNVVEGAAVEGIVINSETEMPVPAQVYIGEGEYYTYADLETGFYRLYVSEPGEHVIYADQWGYYPYESETLTIGENDTITLDIEMTPYPSGTIEGFVTDLANYPIEGATVTAFQEIPQPPVTTDADGFYQIICPGSYTYDVRIEANGYEPRNIEVSVPIDGTVEADFDLAILQSFEGDDDGGFYEPRNFDWEHGIPTPQGGPSHAYLGESLWGTVLDANYHEIRNSYLNTPRYYLVPGLGVDYHMMFHHWYETNEGWDGGNVLISNDNGQSWELITPEGGYPETVVALGGRPGYSGFQYYWEQAQFDLTDYEGEWVEFRFRFGSTNGETYRGWFIDRFVVYGADQEVAVDNEISTPHTPQRINLLPNYPNPFNPKTTIAFELPQSMTVSLKIYDIAGQLIRTLTDQQTWNVGRHTITWNGMNENEQAVSSGVYFYRLTTEDFEDTKQMILLR